MAVFSATATGTVESPPGSGTETFTGANGSGPPDPWIAVTFSGSQSIQSNKWRITNGSSYLGTAMTRGTTPYADVDITVTVTTDTVGGEQYPGVGARLSGGTNGWATYAEPNNGYGCWLHTLASGFAISRYAAGVEESTQYAAFTFAANTDYKIRFQLIGSSLKGRVWLASASEPSTWNVERTDATYTTGLVGFKDCAPLNTTISTWDNYTLDTDPTGGGNPDVLGNALHAATFTSVATGTRTRPGTALAAITFAGVNTGTSPTTGGGAAVVAALAGR